MNELMTNCYYRVGGNGEAEMFCWGGYLHYSAEPHEPVMVAGIDQGGMKAACPACSGKAVIPTPEGEKLLRFLELFAPTR